MSTKYLGNLTELQCITRFYELGYPVSIPYGDSEKYDMIVDGHRVYCTHWEMCDKNDDSLFKKSGRSRLD